MTRARKGDRSEVAGMFSEAAEQAVLSAMMLDTEIVPTIRRQIRSDAFYKSEHRAFYDAMASLHDREITVDPLTLSDELARRGQLDNVGGREYVAYLIDVVPTTANVEYHIGIVKRHAARRTLLHTLDSSRVALLKDADDPTSIARQLQAETLGVAIEDEIGGFRVVDTADIEALAQEIMRRGEATASGVLPGLPTGFREIDAITNGYRPGEFVVIGAVPKAWKSSFVDNIAINLARRGFIGGKVSAEMTREETLERMIAADGMIESLKLSRGLLDDHEWRRFGESGALLRDRFHIDDEAFPALNNVVARCIELKARVPKLQYIVVDYLQLITDPDGHHRRSDEEINVVCRTLKGLAKRLQVVIFAPAQCNYKEVEARPDKRPTPRDIQGASGPAQTANHLLLLYNDALYNPTAPNVLEVNNALARRCPTFTVILQMYPQYQLLGDLTPGKVRAA